MKLFLVCCCSRENDLERMSSRQVLRQLRARGHEISLLDLPTMPFKRIQDFNSVTEYFGRESYIQAIELMQRSDAVLIMASSQLNYFVPKLITQMTLHHSNNSPKWSSSIWNQDGVSCTILGPSVKRQKVAKELWAVLSASSYDRLDISDIIPFGMPRTYNCDPRLETAGPCVV